MGPIIVDALVAITFLGLCYLYFVGKRRMSGLPLPPGPKKLPLVGNLFNMPRELMWEPCHRWSKELDTDILHFDVAGTSIIVIGTYQAAEELLEKRSSIHSGRPRLPMLTELMGWGFDFGFMDYGTQWRKHRRLMHNTFHSSAAKKFRPYGLKAARNLLRNILDDPDDILGNLRHLSGENIVSATYGFTITSKSDQYIALAKAAIQPVVCALIPGTFLVDVIPALKYIPAWFPGAGFKKKAKEWEALALAMRDRPFEDVKAEIKNGTAGHSFCRSSLENVNESMDLAEAEDDIKSVAGTMYLAGSDTTMAALATIVLALLNSPEVLKKAQADVDRVVKPGTLPTFDDEASLPYITAIVQEGMRWKEVTSFGLPHLSHAEDEYRGYRIPKGSIMLPNIWGMLHDEAVYSDPFTFNPDRFMTADGQLAMDDVVQDPNLIVWGFGRRICPGRYFAGSSLWIAVVSLVAAFDFERVDETGGLDQPYETDFVRTPLPFNISLRPRSKEIEAAILSSEGDEYMPVCERCETCAALIRPRW